MSTNYYQEKITSFPGGLTRTVRSAPLANVAKFRAEAGDISVFDVYTDFVSAGAQQFTLKINGVDQIPVAGNRPDLNGVDHDTWTPAAPIAVNDGDIISVDLTAVGGAGVNAPLYIRIGIDVAGGAAGVVETIVAGAGITVDDTDPANPIVEADAFVQTVSAGTGITVDNTDPQNPVIEASGGGGGGDGLYSPDFPYGTPSTEDDEFDAGSLDGKWTAHGAAMVQAFDIPNNVTLSGAGSGFVGAIMQNTTNTNRTWRMKISGSDKNNAVEVGFFVRSGSNRCDTFVYTANGLRFYQKSGSNSSTVGTSTDLTGADVPKHKATVGPLWLELEYQSSGTVLIFRASSDGVTFTDIVSTTTYFGDPISQIGIQCLGTAAVKCYVDWFRRLQGTYTGGNS